MLRSVKKLEERMRLDIGEAVAAALAAAGLPLPETETQGEEAADANGERPPTPSEAFAKDLVDRIIEAMGPAAMRRRIQGDIQNGFKDGFLTGRVAGRLSRWHSAIWRASQSFAMLKEAERRPDAGRYDRYNF